MPKLKKRNSSPKLSQATLDELFAFKPSTAEIPQKRHRAYLLPSESGDSEDDIAEIHFERKPDVVTIDSDDDEPIVSSPPRSLVKRRKVAINSDEELSCPPLSSPTLPSPAIAVDDDDDDDDGPIRRTGGSKRIPIIPDIDSDDEISQPRRRKLVKGKAPSPKLEDVEDLAGEVDEERILDTRLRERGKRTAFQRNLDKLKRKKQGLDCASSSDEEASSHNDDPLEPFAGARPDNDANSDSDDYSKEDSETLDDAFIVDDDGAGIPDLPPEFSMSSHEDLGHQFKKIFQFFVHIAIQPPQERHNFMSRQMKTQQYFSVPLQIVRRKLSGLRDSLVASSVWRADFRKALSTYPEISLDVLDFAIPQCDACHLGGRLSTLIGRLSGNPYDPMGFEGTDNGADSDEEEHAHEFHLGRFCARRTRVFHKFTHWEYSLFSAIRREIDELEMRQQGDSSKKKFVRIAFVGAMQPPDDLSDADAICDYLDSRKVIDMEWQLIKSMMESARNLEISKAKGDDMDG